MPIKLPQPLSQRSSRATYIKDDLSVKGRTFEDKGKGGYVCGPYSWHESGRQYTWHAAANPTNTELAPLPDWIAAELKKSEGAPKPVEHYRAIINSPLFDGQRNSGLASIVGHLVGCCVDPILVRDIALLINRQAVPPEDERKIERMVENILKRELAK